MEEYLACVGMVACEGILTCEGILSLWRDGEPVKGYLACGGIVSLSRGELGCSEMVSLLR